MTDPRIDPLLAALTLDEKLAMVHAADTFRNAGVPRLGIPPLVMSDGPHGVRQEVVPGTFQPLPGADDATTYLPNGITLAASWDPALAVAAGAVLGAETRARGKDVILGPGVNLLRTPLCGRNFEYFGEDPVLAGTIAAGYIRGVQGQGVAACVKHFACNNQELDRTRTDAVVSERALRELYLPAFRAAVRAGVLTVMGAYNRVNGAWATHHPELTRRILKEEWGFAGLVVSDWGSTHAAGEALRDGLDLEMGTNLHDFAGYHFGRELAADLAAGRVDVRWLDEAVRRILGVLIAIGAMDEGRSAGRRGTAAHHAAAQAVAEAGIVVLRHAGGPPVDPARSRTLAVIGANADRLHAGGGGSSGVRAFDEVTPLRGLRERLPGIDVRFARGWPDLPGGVEAIPARLLAAPDSAGIGGWRCEVFANTRYQGEPVRTATVPEPRLARDERPAPGLGALGWSVRWTGELRVPADGAYVFYTTGMDNWQVRIDGAFAANVWGLGAPHTEIIERTFTAGQTVRIEVLLNPKAEHAEMGFAWLPPGAPRTGGGADEAVALAAACDAVVVVGGLDHRQDTEGVDRSGYGLPDGQDAVIARILDARPDATVVLTGGGPSALPWADRVRTLLWAGYGGAAAGTALARILCGDVEPRGRLPFTWWRELADCPAHRHGEHRDGVWHTATTCSSATGAWTGTARPRCSPSATAAVGRRSSTARPPRPAMATGSASAAGSPIRVPGMRSRWSRCTRCHQPGRPPGPRRS
jgi:beta-glucosidase